METSGKNTFAMFAFVALFLLTSIGGGFAMSYAINSRADEKPFHTTQQQGSIGKFISPTPLPTKPPTVNNLVECQYGEGQPGCIASKPATCIPWSESKVLAASQQPGPDGILHAWYTDEHALTLGGGTVSPINNSPDHVLNPNTGNPSVVDSEGRPSRPAVFITDITNNAADRSGDWEYGGKAYDPTEIFGTWKVLNGPDPAGNGSNLGIGSSPLPVIAQQGYVSEIRWNLLDPKFALVKGHSYRLEFMVHDGDGGGGDAGEKCSSISL